VSRRTVIITGATKGLGRAIAIAFASGGDRVIGIYAHDEPAAEELRHELRGLGAGDSIGLTHDVTSDGASLWDRREIQQAERLVLINNACAAFSPRPFHLLQWDEVQRGLDVGLKGSWQCSRAVLRAMMRAGNGTIVNVLTTAISGLPPKGFAAYAAAKHAVRGLTLALASEYGDKGVRVFSVSPGFMLTSLTAGWDARVVEGIRAAGAVSDSAAAAQRIRQLVEDPDIGIGRGEDYSI